jgi:hypothetical protein
VTVGKYQKRPLLVDAIQWDYTEETAKAVRAALAQWAPAVRLEGCLDGSAVVLPNGQRLKLDSGDWLVHSLIDGSVYPVKRDTFEKTYIRVCDEGEIVW